MSNYLQTRQRLIHSRMSPSKRSQTQNIDQNITNLGKHHQSYEDYDAIIDFELARQKEKNRIFEERLRNKEIFIQQMRQHQQELTHSFQNCQKQLSYTKRKLSHLQDTEIRKYLQEIAQLKHLVIRLEDQINIYERNHSKHYNSVKTKHNQQQPHSPPKKKQRSKTLMHNQEETPKDNKLYSPLQDQINHNLSKVANFISHFLGMIQLYNKQASLGKLKGRLKIGWRWIKKVVKQWHFLQKESQQYEKVFEEIRTAGKLSSHLKLSDIQEAVCDILRSKG